jgi:hypothetical protein
VGVLKKSCLCLESNPGSWPYSYNTYHLPLFEASVIAGIELHNGKYDLYTSPILGVGKE